MGDGVDQSIVRMVAACWFVIACIAAASAPMALRDKDAAPATRAFPGWPETFEDRELTPLPLSPLEERFQQDFPGRLARFSDGNREIILRWIVGESRKLHPSSDCFKAAGYAVAWQPIKRNGFERWSVFIATRGKEKLLVSERIVDQSGRQWTDVSAWYWAAQMRDSRGPWWAVTVAQKL